MTLSPQVSLVVPLLDEEGNVEELARELFDVFDRANVPIVVILVDNGSGDRTRELVLALAEGEPRIKPCLLDRNAGYGGGILAGMRLATTPILGWMWGDRQVLAVDALRVYRRLLQDEADLCKARRVRRDDGWRRLLVTRFYNVASLWLFHVQSADANGCPKLFTRQAWERLAPRSEDWFLDPEVMIGAARHHLKIAEVDVVSERRKAGRSKVHAGTVVEFIINMARFHRQGGLR